jgi:hypothetical protein
VFRSTSALPLNVVAESVLLAGEAVAVDVDPLGLLHLLLFGLDSEIAGGGQLVSGHGATGL